MQFAHKQIYHFIAGTLCLALLVACKNETPNISSIEEADSKILDTSFYKVMVDNLRMREAPNLESSTLILLPQGVVVRTWGERSLREDEIQLRGTLRRDFWYRAKYENHDGWIFGGALDKIGDDPKDNYLIIPDRQFGPVLATDSEADIVNRIGRENVNTC